MKTGAIHTKTLRGEKPIKANKQASTNAILQAYKQGKTISKNSKRRLATIGEKEIAGVINPLVEYKRGTAITAHVNVIRQPYLDQNNVMAVVDASASGLAPDDWADYQIQWGKNAVPGYDGVQLHNPHLGQQIGQAGGWVTDKPPLGLGVVDPTARSSNNSRYFHPNNYGNWQGPNWDFRDVMCQDQNMAQGVNNVDRQWKFRVIVKNSWGVPIKASNEVVIQW